MTDPVFLDFEDVLLIHGEPLALYGASPGIRDVTPGACRGLRRASAGGEFVHPDLFAMVAA